MKLNIQNRLAMFTILPGEGSRIEMTTIKGIVEKIDFTLEEKEKYEIKNVASGVSHTDENLEYEKEIEFHEVELQLIKTQLKKLEDEKKVNKYTLDLFEIFSL